MASAQRFWWRDPVGKRKLDTYAKKKKGENNKEERVICIFVLIWQLRTLQKGRKNLPNKS